MHNRPGKYLLIKRIVRLSKESHEYFGAEILNELELYLMKVNDLLNVEAELRVRLRLPFVNYTTYSYNSTNK